MKTIQNFVLGTMLAVVLFSTSGCTIIGIGVGAAAGSGTSVGVIGGAVIGGVIGHEIAD